MEITYEERRIVFSEGGDSPAILRLFTSIGVVFLLGAGAAAYFAVTGTLHSDFFILAGFFGLFGILLITASHANGKRMYSASVTIDGDTQRVIYRHNRVRDSLEIGFGEVTKAHAYSRREQSQMTTDQTTSRMITVWPVQLELTDGSTFWLATVDTRDEATDLVKRIADAIGVPGIVEETTVSRGDPARMGEYRQGKAQVTADRSHYLVESGEEGSVSYTVNRTFTVGDIATLVIIAIFMTTVAAAASGLLSGDGFSPFGIVGGLVPLGIIAFILFLLFRRYRIVLFPDRLVVELHLRPGYSAPSKTIEIPSSALRAVRMNRLEQGVFRLSVSVDRDFEIPVVTVFLANLGAFGRNKHSEADSTRSIGLWEIPPQGAAPFGADFRDLRYLERRIEGFYGLEKAPPG